MSEETGAQRRILTQISPVAWEHPADRAALNALRKVPGFDLALRKIFGLFGERAIRLAFKANAVRVSANQYGWIQERLERVCEVLDVDKPPEVYISQTPVVNAGAVGMGDPFIVLNSSMLEILSPDEVEAVLGHEVGHILSGHVLYRTLLIIILNLVVFRYTIVGLAIRPILMGLMEWYRKSELSSDRAGLLSVQYPKVTMSALMQMAGGMRGQSLDLDEFVALSDEYRQGGDLLDAVYKVLNVLGQTHPFAVIRVGELRDWIESGAYDRILTGEYQRRD
jgi:Zn-dependent protease with chaperone function